nr:dynamin family protein [uncultured Anaerostipes sp.]
MKNVSISYNPYKLTTHITVDEMELAENSELRERSADGNRLQEWVEDLPDMLLKEFNDNKFAVSFHGTIMDYEDLKEVLDEAQEQHKFWYHLKWEKAQEAADKEKLIDEVFREIQNGPFEELKSDEIKTAFQNAKSKDFEVCVVATMSAGKSTLINAMLGKELMPSKAGACTAMITRIKDVDRLKDSFRAEVYRKGRISESYEKLNYSTMERLNEDDTVDEVRVYGNMPFVSSDELSLVLVDTPGPNNARDDSHEEVQQNALGKSSKALVLYIMTNEYGTDDDEITLRRVANTMSVGGKQSKDRFLFVVNKMDSRNKNDGSTEETLDQVREYLKAQGINNPNLFPVAALPALNIRRVEKEKVDEDIEEETEYLIRKLNRNEQLHLEKYASLPGNEKEDIEEQLKEIRKEWKEKVGEKYENPQEALIHTGIISIEAAIRQYVEKYAKTARIKNLVDTFAHVMEELDYNEKAKIQLERYQEKRDEISRKIEEENLNLHNYGKASSDAEAAFQKIVFDTEETADKIGHIYKKMLQEINVIGHEKCKEWENEKYSYFKCSFAEFMQERARGIPIIMQKSMTEIHRLFLDNMTEIKDLFENIKKEIRERAENESYRRIAEESGRLQEVNNKINYIENKLKWLGYIREKMNAILEI